MCLYIRAPTDYFGEMSAALLSCHGSLKYFLSIFSLKILITTIFFFNVNVTQRGTCQPATPLISRIKQLGKMKQELCED